jgi:hypothetical protein
MARAAQTEQPMTKHIETIMTESTGKENYHSYRPLPNQPLPILFVRDTFANAKKPIIGWVTGEAPTKQLPHCPMCRRRNTVTLLSQESKGLAELACSYEGCRRYTWTQNI